MNLANFENRDTGSWSAEGSVRTKPSAIVIIKAFLPIFLLLTADKIQSASRLKPFDLLFVIRMVYFDLVFTSVRMV